MRILVYAYGSQGDVQPYLALAHAATEAGHHVRLVAPRRFADHAAEYDIDFYPWNDESLDMLTDPRFQNLAKAERGSRAQMREAGRRILDECFRLYPILLREAAEAAAGGADLIVHTQASAEAVHQIGEKLGVPTVMALMYPNYVTSWHYPSSMFATVTGAPRLFNRLSHAVAARIKLPRQIRGSADQWRTDVLQLPPRPDALNYRRQSDGSPTTFLHGFSRYALPDAPDWPPWVHRTGFWHLPASDSWTPPAQLVDFLAAGPAVAVGFGSLAGGDPHGTGRQVLRALRKVKVRAVVATGWGGVEIAEASDDVLIVDQVPHDWLFPRVAVAVHAGGGGTCHAALRAGVPQVAAPFHGEQRMWSQQMHRIGVATRPLPQRELTADNLAAMLQHAVNDPVMRETAGRLGRLVREEDGAAQAITVLQQVTARAAQRRSTAGL